MDLPIRIVLADSDTLLRHCLAEHFQHHRGLAVVGEATTGREAVTLAEGLQPDVLVLDPLLPADGPGLIGEVGRAAPHCRVLVLTLRGDDSDAPRYLQAGARGYLRKDTPSRDLQSVRRAIRRVHQGELVVGPAVADRVLQELGRTREEALGHERLTSREREVLAILSEGRTNGEIAGALHITEHTVKNHVAAILHKLGLTNRVEAVVYANAHGLVAGARSGPRLHLAR